MVLHFNSHQRLSSSPSRGDIHPKTQLSVSRLVHGPIRAALRRFPQTSSTLAPLPVISLAFLLSLLVPPPNSGAQEVNIDQTAPRSLKQLSLEQLGNLEVTTVSKEPEEIQRTAAAIYVLTQEDIRRSGATSIPEVLRLVPGVEVAQIDSSTWAVGIRGFGSIFSKSVHHHQEFQRQPGNVGFRWRRQCGPRYRRISSGRKPGPERQLSRLRNGLWTRAGIPCRRR